MTAPHFVEFNKTPQRRARASAWCRKLNSDPMYRASRGWLTEQQRQLIVADIRSGRRFIDIATDWLVNETTVSRIAREHGLQRQTHPKRKSRGEK